MPSRSLRRRFTSSNISPRIELSDFQIEFSEQLSTNHATKLFIITSRMPIEVANYGECLGLFYVPHEDSHQVVPCRVIARVPFRDHSPCMHQLNMLHISTVASQRLRYPLLHRLDALGVGEFVTKRIPHVEHVHRALAVGGDHR